MKKTGLKREIIDKFYTSINIANKCINFIKENIDIQENDICIEPSAGNGSFINPIKTLFKIYKFYDLKPENNEILEQDYLNFDYNMIIQSSCEYCDSISFILPKSFKKDSLKKHFPLNFHLIYEYDLPANSFIIDEKEYDVPCVFQIWLKKNINREVQQKLQPHKYKFVKINENPDISFRRVGVYAGRIDTNIEDKSIQSHYFIKFDSNIFTEELLKKLNIIEYSCKNNTAGPKSISKQELMKEFNNVI